RLAAQVEQPAVPDDQQAGRGDHEPPDAAQDQLDALGEDGLADGAVMACGVTALLAWLAAEGADDADPAERLVHAPVDLAAILADRSPDRAGLAHVEIARQRD